MTCRALDDVLAEAECIDNAAKEADEELQRIYTKLMACISPGGQGKLRALEAHWLAYRKAQCEFSAAGLEGFSHTAWGAAFDYCYEGITTRHAQELRSQLDCEEGVIGCGGQ